MADLVMTIFIGFIITFTLFVFFFVWLYRRTWKMPVVIFKLVGDKRRPMLDLSKKGKILVQNGVKRLKIRGMPILWEMKNFKNENYYMDTRGRPSLVLFEFAKSCYTPYKPSLFGKALSRIRKQEIIQDAPLFVPVNVQCDPELYQKLLLKAVDDFDPDFIVRNFGRIDRQYTGNLAAFLKESGWIIGWLLLFLMFVVGIALFFQQAPDIAAACASAGVDSSQQVIDALAGRLPAG